MKKTINLLFFVVTLVSSSTSPILACETYFEPQSMYALPTFAKAIKEPSGLPTEQSLRVASVNHLKNAVETRRLLWEEVKSDLHAEARENIAIQLLDALYAKIEIDFGPLIAAGDLNAVQALAYIQLASLYLSISPDLHLSAMSTFSLDSLTRKYPAQSVLSPFFNFGPKLTFLDETAKDLQTLFAIVFSVNTFKNNDLLAFETATLSAGLDLLVKKVFSYGEEAVLTARELGLKLAVTKEIPTVTQMNHALSQGYYLLTAPEVTDSSPKTSISSQKTFFSGLIQLQKIKSRLLDFTPDEAESFKNLLSKLASAKSIVIDGVSINALANALIFEVWHQSNRDEIFTSKNILKGITSGAVHLTGINRTVAPEHISRLGHLELSSETSRYLTRKLEYFFERALAGHLSIGRRIEITTSAPLSELVVLPGLFSRVGLSHVPVSAPELIYRAALHLLVELQPEE